MNYLFIAAFLVGAAWSCVNFYFLFRIIKLGFSQKTKKANKILPLLIFKFPVLYLSGFAILTIRIYPVSGLLLGLSVPLAAVLLLMAIRKKKIILPVFLLAYILMPAVSAFSEEAAAQSATPELLNVFTLLSEHFHGSAAGKFIQAWQNVFFSLMVTFILAAIAFLASRKSSLVPHRIQNLVEMAVEMLDDFVKGILGERGRRFTPFLGTLFIYIMSMNLFGLLPFMKSPTSAFTTTFPLAICVFAYVQYTGIKENGFVGYLKHMAGSPADAIGWALSPIMFIIHIFGEVIKPISLSLRLFGNIWGEDLLIAVFVLLGVSALKFLPIPLGIPFQTPFIFLAIITSVVQAMVFTLLSTIYFALMMPHEAH